MSKNKHLTLDDRFLIELSLNKRMSFKAIGTILEKDCTTVSKEIKTHVVFEKKGAHCRPFNDCINRRNCNHYGDICLFCSRKHRQICSVCGKCNGLCTDYLKEECTLLSKPPYVCNGCLEKHECTLEKHLYKARMAQQEYEEVRSESRSGFNLTEAERLRLDSVISPLLKNGQSLHHIITHNSDIIQCCEKTAYTYADNGLFEARNIDMPRKVRFRPRKQKSVGLKVDKACRTGRTYEDFKTFMESNPSLPVVQLDTVEGIKGGSVLLTVHFVRQGMQLAFLRECNDSKSVTDIFNSLYDRLCPKLYMKLFPVLLADNGSEFSNPKALEFDAAGNRRSRVFYCEPASPSQKGACEVNHEFIRRIIPKGVDIGIYSAEDIRLMMDHINSYSRAELGDKSPFEMFEFYYDLKTLGLLGVSKVAPNDIILSPRLLYKKKPSV